jgi:hypothetical protein
MQQISCRTYNICIENGLELRSIGGIESQGRSTFAPQQIGVPRAPLAVAGRRGSFCPTIRFRAGTNRHRGPDGVQVKPSVTFTDY